jgi:hypothetical protein
VTALEPFVTLENLHRVVSSCEFRACQVLKVFNSFALGKNSDCQVFGDGPNPVDVAKNKVARMNFDGISQLPGNTDRDLGLQHHISPEGFHGRMIAGKNGEPVRYQAARVASSSIDERSYHAVGPRGRRAQASGGQCGNSRQGWMAHPQAYLLF